MCTHFGSSGASTCVSIPSAGRYCASLSGRCTPPPPAGGKNIVTSSTFTARKRRGQSSEANASRAAASVASISCIAVRGREEPRLELRGREVDAALEHRAVKAGEALGVGVALRIVPIPDRRAREEEPEHRPHPDGLRGDARLSGCVSESLEEALARSLDPVPHARLGERAQRLDPSSHRERVPGERPGLIHGAGRCDELHDLAPAAVRADREPAADHLAECRQVGLDAVQRLRAAGMHAEAGHHLVEDQQRAVRGGERAQALEEALLREDETHVPRDRLDDDRGDLVLGEEVVDGLEVVERRGQRVGGGALRDSGRVREPERRDARARLHEQEVGVPVVAARELDDRLAAGERARKPQRAHRRLGARGHEADELDARQRIADEPRELELERARRAEARTTADCVLQRGDHPWVRVAEDQRPPREDVVDVAIPVDVDEVGALPALDEQRRPADRLERADGRAHAPGHQLRRLREEPLGLLDRSCLLARSHVRSGHENAKLQLVTWRLFPPCPSRCGRPRPIIGNRARALPAASSDGESVEDEDTKLQLVTWRPVRRCPAALGL